MVTKFSEDVVPLTDLKVNPGRVVRHTAHSHRPVLLTSAAADGSVPGAARRAGARRPGGGAAGRSRRSARCRPPPSRPASTCRARSRRRPWCAIGCRTLELDVHVAVVAHAEDERRPVGKSSAQHVTVEMRGHRVIEGAIALGTGRIPEPQTLRGGTAPQAGKANRAARHAFSDKPKVRNFGLPQMGDLRVPPTAWCEARFCTTISTGSAILEVGDRAISAARMRRGRDASTAGRCPV